MGNLEPLTNPILEFLTGLVLCNDQQLLKIHVCTSPIMSREHLLMALLVTPWLFLTLLLQRSLSLEERR